MPEIVRNIPDIFPEAAAWLLPGAFMMIAGLPHGTLGMVPEVRPLRRMLPGFRVQPA